MCTTDRWSSVHIGHIFWCVEVTLVIGICALISNNRHGWPEADNWTVAPAAAGICLAFGVLCVNLALRSPGARSAASSDDRRAKALH